MTRKTIAPVLQDFIRYYGYDGHPMRKEVAALLAVARAADALRWSSYSDERIPSLNEALDRLARLSGGGRRKR